MLSYKFRGRTHDVGVEQVPAALCCFHILAKTSNFSLLLLDDVAVSLSFQLKLTSFPSKLRVLLRNFLFCHCEFCFEILV
jgi:hypothetical protein